MIVTKIQVAKKAGRTTERWLDDVACVVVRRWDVKDSVRKELAEVVRD